MNSSSCVPLRLLLVANPRGEVAKRFLKQLTKATALRRRRSLISAGGSKRSENPGIINLIHASPPKELRRY